MLSSCRLKFIFICLISYTCCHSFAAESLDKFDDKRQYTYHLSYDKYMSSKASSDLALSALEFYRQAEDAVYQKEGFFTPILVNFIRYFTVYHLMLANHEIGGHGSRGREFGARPSRYRINFMSGAASFWSYQLRVLPKYKNIMITTGGMQASYLFSQNIKFRNIELNEVNPAYGVAYVVSTLDQPGYISSTKDAGNTSGNDVDGYIQQVNSLYGDKHLSLRKLKSYAFLDLFDPLLFYSLSSFLLDKKIAMPFLMLNKNIGYLPATRAILTPYGPEMGLLNLLKINDKIVEVELNYGNNPKASSYAFGIRSHNFIHADKLTLGGRLITWSQPHFFAEKPDNSKKKKGRLIGLNGQWDFNKNLGINIQLGYKSAGFVVGESPEAGGFFKSSLVLRF